MTVSRDDASGSHGARSRLSCLPSGCHGAGRRRDLTSLQNASKLSSVPQDILLRLNFPFDTDRVDAAPKPFGL